MVFSKDTKTFATEFLETERLNVRLGDFPEWNVTANFRVSAVCADPSS